MTISEIESSLKPNRQSHKILRGTFILLAASSLFACSQPDSSAAESSAVATEYSAATTSGTSESSAEYAPVMTAATGNPQLLKNVSATVYKDANCGCCKDWIDHAQSNGLKATAEHPKDLSLFKDRYEVPNEMRSCHTAVTTDGYVFEGHVPAKYMAQFLENPPVQALGLAVPGMPVGSPGMEYENKFMPYQIMQLNKDGTTQVYADIESTEQQL